MKARLLITGGAGFLGRHLLERAKNFVVFASLHQTPALSYSDVSFRICNLQQSDDINFLLDRVRPEILIHTACSDQGNGIGAIVPAAVQLALQTAQRQIRFIHLSTDQVFNGLSSPYAEESPRSPINPYGVAKAEAEEKIQVLNPQATIIRTSLLYDLRTPDRQTQWLIQGCSTPNEDLRLFVDEFRCPIWVENLADGILEIASLDLPGILHMGGPQSIHRWDLGMGLLKHFHVTPTPNIIPGTIEELGLTRPKNLTMNSTRAQATLQTPLLSLQEACQMHQSSKK